jgi:Flp pilus assembly protein TadG
VEFALVAPLLFLLLFGMIEFGWFFAQSLDVRHGAREASRILAVDGGSGASATARGQDALCQAFGRMSFADDVSGSISFPGGSGADNRGDEVTVTLTKTYDSITGFLDPVVDGIDMTSEVTSRLEQDASFGPVTNYPDSSCP